MFIESNFYELYSLLNNFSPSERKDQFEDLMMMIFEELGIAGQYKFKFVETDDMLGYFDSVENEIAPIHEKLLFKQLSFNDMYEIIEGLLHEPEHALQYEESLKDSSKFEFFNIALPVEGGYVLQTEEQLAFTKTFAKMQEIINRHLTCVGKELEFYSGMQTYLREKREWFNRAIDIDTQKFRIRSGQRSIDDNDIQSMIHNMKYFANINAEIVKYRESKVVPDFSFKFHTNILESNGKTSSNICTVYVKGDKMHGSIELPGDFDNTNITFRINNYNLEISNLFGVCEDSDKLQRLAQSVYKFKNFYRQEFGRELRISNAEYCVGEDDSYFDVFKRLCFAGFLEGADVDDVEEVNSNFTNENFKFKINNYIKGDIELNELLDAFETKIKFNKNLILGNEEEFREHLSEMRNCKNFKEFKDNLSDIKLNSVLGKENIDTIVAKVSVFDRIRSVFKKRDDIDR